MSSNFERLHEIIQEAYPESFNILSWKTRKWVTFWHPYLRILFPFIKRFEIYILYTKYVVALPYYVEFWFTFSDEMITKRDFSKIINLYFEIIYPFVDSHWSSNFVTCDGHTFILKKLLKSQNGRKNTWIDNSACNKKIAKSSFQLLQIDNS